MRSKPHNEDFLYQQLISREIEVYYPKLLVAPVNPRSRTAVPYFPGYLFIRHDLSKSGIRSLNRIPGAVGLVHFGDSVPCVPDVVIENIKQTLDGLGTVDRRKRPKHQAGDQVQITRGPLAGYNAIFDTYLQGHERVRVLLEMLSDRKVALELGCDEVE